MNGSASDRAFIVVAEDSPEMRSYLERILRPLGVVEAVSDGLQALELVRQRPPDLLLSDVLMPKLDGVGLLRAVREDPQTRDLPVVLLSARAAEEERIEGVTAGADDYIIKPFSTRELVARVGTQLALSRERKKSEANRAFQAGLLSRVHDAVVATDESLRVTYWNHAAEETFGWRADEAIGRAAEDLFQSEVVGRTRDDVTDQLLRAGHYEGEVVYHRKDGSSFFADVRSAVLKGAQGEMRGLVSSVRDVTERKRAEAALRAREEQLAAELGVTTRLHRITTRFVREGELGAVQGEIVDAAIAITRADMGALQLYDPRTRKARVAAQRGLGKPLLDFLEGGCWDAAWGAAVARGERVVVEDVERGMAGTEALAVHQRGGVVAVQLTPLLGGSSKAVGALLTYHRRPNRPDERDLRFLDLLAGQTAEMIERAESETALRRSDERLRLAQSAAMMGIWESNLETNTTEWTQELEALFGIPPGRGRPEEWEQHVHPDDRGRITVEIERAIAEHRVFDLEFRILHPSGKVRWFNSRGGAIYDQGGRPTRLLGVTIDVTERKALREADQSKNEFLAMLSHELRNPLAPIRNSLFVLERAPAGGEQARAAQAVIDRQVTHLTRLVDDLLDVTRITQGKVQLRRELLELGDLVRRTAEDHRAAFVENGIRFETRLAAEPMWLTADATRISQVVGNLLGNATKFTPPGGRVELTLGREQDAARLTVRDDGVGIVPEVLGHLFQPFTQAAQTLDRSRGGLGLGLALVKTLVELHGGQVQVTSEGQGRGAQFSVRLPLEAAPRRAAPAGEARPNRPCRVLVIEDNREAADSLEMVLELVGHKVKVAYDGPSGLTVAKDFRPEVVLCDVGLPGMSGYDVARAFRARDDLRGAVLVALTGYALPEDKRRALEAGFAHHVAKPASLETLERLLDSTAAQPT
jgi:PAS domain S-box-containing protein